MANDKKKEITQADLDSLSEKIIEMATGLSYYQFKQVLLKTLESAEGRFFYPITS